MSMTMRNPQRLLTPWARQVLTLSFVGLFCAVALSAYAQILQLVIYLDVSLARLTVIKPCSQVLKYMPQRMRYPRRLLSPWTRLVLALGFVVVSCAVALSAYMLIFQISVYLRTQFGLDTKSQTTANAPVLDVLESIYRQNHTARRTTLSERISRKIISLCAYENGSHQDHRIATILFVGWDQLSADSLRTRELYRRGESQLMMRPVSWFNSGVPPPL